MKGVIEFDLDDMNEFRDHQCALRGKDLALLLYDLKDTLTSRITYGLDRRKTAVYREIIKMINDGLEEREINLESLLR